MHRLTSEQIDNIVEPIGSQLKDFESAYIPQFETDALFLAPLLSYLSGMKGKRLRPILYFLCQGLVGRSHPGDMGIAILIELLHAATLIHDDVVDDSAHRRGKASIHAVWGNRAAVLLGDYLLARVLTLAVETRRDGVMDIIAEAALSIGQGELEQTLCSVSQRIDRNAYFRIIQAKTASLFAAACNLGGLVSDVSPIVCERLRRLGMAFGMAFQIRDDILDYTGRAEMLGKPVGQDASDGVMTLPLIAALDAAPQDERAILLQDLERDDQPDAGRIQTIVSRYRGVELAQAEARKTVESALVLLSQFQSSPYRDALERLIQFDLDRSG